MGEIISFYSYKGGVGRSMALANLAVLLAQRKRRVLAIDFDLDAPGLHRYFLRDGNKLGAPPGGRPGASSDDPRASPPDGQYGVIDMFREMDIRVREESMPLEPEGSPPDPRPAIPGIVRRLLDAGNYAYYVRVRDPATDTPAVLRLLTAGRFDDRYMARVQGFPWERLVEEHRTLFDELAAGWRQRYEYVLVDSRTGVSDIGSISTVILADKLVLAFAPNEQSLHGALEVGRQAVKLRRATSGKDLPIFPLVSRVDLGEEALRIEFIEDAAKRFAKLFDELYGSGSDPGFTAYFRAVQIPHVGYYAYGERISAERDTPADINSLAAGYARFLDCVQGDRLAGWADRMRDPLRALPRDRALVVSLESEIEPPASFAFERIIRAPERLAVDTSTRLRAVPVDVEAWTQALAEIDGGVARAAKGGSGDLHVFATMPYPAAVYLGRRLDDLARAKPLRIHQLDPVTHDWVLFSADRAAESPEATPFYRDLEESFRAVSGDAVILGLEGMRPIGEDALHVLADRLDAAAIYRLRPRSAAPLRSLAEAKGAVAAVRSALLRVQADRPAGSGPVHIIATAPVALLIELGRLVVPTVYRSVIVHQFDAQAAAYVPVLDVIARRVM